MNIIIKYECPLCQNQYLTEQDAIDCMNTPDDNEFKVGDIVECKYGFGWYDGDKNWVINPDVDTSKHGFGPDRSMGFYYVITHIEKIKHRTRYHLFTKAMLNNYSSGFTYKQNHYAPRLIDAPEIVIDTSKDLIGKKAEHLL